MHILIFLHFFLKKDLFNSSEYVNFVLQSTLLKGGSNGKSSIRKGSR